MAQPRRPRGHRRVRETASSRYPTPPHEGVVGVLYDSDVIIELLRGRRPIVEAARRLEQSGVQSWYSAVSVAEIHAGLRPGEEAFTHAFFDARSEVVVTAEVGRVAGAYLARFSRSHGLELGDALIAAAATAAGLHLWTRNRKHYPMSDLRFYEV